MVSGAGCLEGQNPPEPIQVAGQGQEGHMLTDEDIYEPQV